jgi:hypothetical protein
MPILKDTEREQLRQLVKACLLEISKLKIELKKCQNESKDLIKQEKDLLDEKNQQIHEIQKLLQKKEVKINDLNVIIKEKDIQLEESKKIKFYFDALTARPRKDLTSFQSQVYQLLGTDKGTIEEHYEKITNIFSELSLDNFNSILKNLERKGYFKSSKENGKIIWRKIGK